MVVLSWLNRLVAGRRFPRSSRSVAERPRERRLQLLRLEPRRVLNADVSFLPDGRLSLSNVDGDLTIRETAHQMEFELTGSIWQDTGDSGLSSGLSIDNSVDGRSILSIAKSELLSLNDGLSIRAADASQQLFLDTRFSPLDLRSMAGPLTIQDFGDIRQLGSHSADLNDVSMHALGTIELRRFSGDDITLSGSEVDFLGGAQSIFGSTLTIATSHVSTLELGGQFDQPHVLDFTDSDIAALDAGFQSLRFQATSTGEPALIHVNASGADFSNALAADSGFDAAPGSLHLSAEVITVDGTLTVPGGFLELSATHDLSVTDHGSLINHGGHVHAQAGDDGTLLVSGTIDVSDSDAGDVGGTLHLFGGHVGLFGDAVVDASGDSGGGEVLIGGSPFGVDATIPHASHTFVGKHVSIHADAMNHGDGGTIVVWSDEVTQVYGQLTARGGALSGNGGWIETSSVRQLIVTRGGDASATNGNAGTWLLDPFNVRIVDVSTVFLISEFSEPPLFNPTISGSEVTAGAIVDQLKTGTTVIISTVNPDGMEQGDVIQDADAAINVTFDNAGDSASFIISAANHIFINGGIRATNGRLNVILEANVGTDDLDTASGNVNINANIDTNGGFFSSTGIGFDSAGANVGNTAATITATGGVSITHAGRVDLGVFSTGVGFGGSTFINGGTLHGTIDVGEGDFLVNAGNEDLIVLADLTATDTVFLLANRDVIIEGTVTAGGPGAPLNPTADLSITADAESDGDGGFWLRETGSAQLLAGGNISIVGAKLIDVAGNTTGTISLRIDADGAADPQIVAGQDLTIIANFGNVSNAGDIVVDGILAATNGSLTTFFTGTTFLSADPSAGTDITFQNAVQLTANVTMTAGHDVIIASTLDDDGNDLTGSALTVNAANDVLFVGAIGGKIGDGLDALSVTSDGRIDFLSSVTIAGNILIAATSAVGQVTFQDVVTTTNSGSVTITNEGLLVTSSSATFLLAGDFVQDGEGSTELGASITTLDGEVRFAQAVVLTDAVTIDTSAGDRNITFRGTIDSEVTGANEQQVISLINATGGTFTISWVPPVPPGTGASQTTAPIAFDATAADVKAALVALPSLSDTDIDVMGDPGGPFTLTFRGAFRGTDVAEVSVSGAGLTGAGATAAVLTIVEGRPVVAEHNPLTLVAGSGAILFNADIGNDFIDVGLGVDGDQTLGDFTIASASLVTFDRVEFVRTAGAIDLGSDSVLTNGITITGTVESTTFESQQSLRINGEVTSDVTLILNAASGILLTDDGSIVVNDFDLVINGDTDNNSVGDLEMGALTTIEVGDGTVDLRAANVILGAVSSTSENGTNDDRPAIRVVATFGSITDANGNNVNLTATTRSAADDPGAGVVLQAVTGIGSGDALETDIASLSAFNHDLGEHQIVTLTNATGGTFTLSWNPPGAAPAATTAPLPFNASADAVKIAFLAAFSSLTEADLEVTGDAGGPYLFTFTGNLQTTDVDEIVANNVNLIGVGAGITAETITDPIAATGNIEIIDVGATTGRLDLIFVRNQANPGNTQDPDHGVIDIFVEDGDLRVVDDLSLPLLLELRRGIDDFNPPDRAVPAIQSENTIRLTANTIEIFDDLMAIQETAPDDQGIGELIEIFARVDFTLGADRVITTDENYLNSLNLGEDLNGNGVLDPGEDINNDGLLQTFPNRGAKPSTFADDPNKDVIRIVADSDLNGPPNGVVFLGIGATISTDSGIQQQIAPRPEKLPSDPRLFIYKEGTAFFSGAIVVSNLQSRFVLTEEVLPDGTILRPGSVVYLGTLTFRIGVPGEKNLVLEIDWGDHDREDPSPIPDPVDNILPPTFKNGVYVFDPKVDQNANRYLIPEGGALYSIPHEYTSEALNLQAFNVDGKLVTVKHPGRTLPSDPFQTRFSVSQHPSILIEGQTILNPANTKPESSGPSPILNAPYDPQINFPYAPDDPELVHAGRFNLTSTNVLDEAEVFLPRFDNGVAAFVIPTSRAAPFIPQPDRPIPPPELPKPVFPEPIIVAPLQVTTETTQSAATSSAITTDEFFELRLINEEGPPTVERLNDFAGEGLLERDRFEQFVRDRGDGEYEIWFITRDNQTGARIERPVIQFRLESGRLAPSENVIPDTFRPLRLIPVPAPAEMPPGDDAAQAPENRDGLDPLDLSPRTNDDRAAGIAPNPVYEGACDQTDEAVSANVRPFTAIVSNVQNSALTALPGDIEMPDHDEATSSDVASMGIGVFLFSGLRRRKNRLLRPGGSLFSKSARLARKFSGLKQDE